MFNVVLTGDWHIQDRKDAVYVTTWLKSHINPKKDKLILMGDLIDTGISRGMGWDQESVNQQLIYLKKVLEPYNVLGYVLGNHERRIFIKTGLNPYQILLGDEKTGYTIGKKWIVIEHGRSGAQNQALELMRLAQVDVTADIVALGHTHDLGIYMLPHGVVGLRTGSLQRYPDYAKRSIMIPKTQGAIRFKPDTNGFEMIY